MPAWEIRSVQSGNVAKLMRRTGRGLYFRRVPDTARTRLNPEPNGLHQLKTIAPGNDSVPRPEVGANPVIDRLPMAQNLSTEP